MPSKGPGAVRWQADGDRRNVMYDFRRSGYENNVTQASPITPRRKLIDTCNITSRPMTRGE